MTTAQGPEIGKSALIVVDMQNDGRDNEYWPTYADEFWPTPGCL